MLLAKEKRFVTSEKTQSETCFTGGAFNIFIPSLVDNPPACQQRRDNFNVIIKRNLRKSPSAAAKGLNARGSSFLDF